MNEKILVVDDNSNNIRLLKGILEDEKFTIFTCNNGLDVFDIVCNEAIDIVLLDIMMPGLDGFEVCKLLNSDFRTKDIPIIMVTAKTDNHELKKALDIGAFDYIKKPIDEIELIARVRSALRFKAQSDELRELATKDRLTGIYNHTLLIELLDKILYKSIRNNENLSFIMLDIDHFKRVNDTYGHPIGDYILREFARLIESSLRVSDILGRYGGEEFGIVLPEENQENAIKFCNRILKTIENHEFKINDYVLNITASIGLFTKQSDEIFTTSEVISKADTALYNAKENGRNRVEKYTPNLQN